MRTTRNPPYDPTGNDCRPMCFACFRPSSHCVCSLVEPGSAHCKILILQHPHERKKYYSTAKLVLRALQNASMLRGVVFEPGVLEKTIDPQKTFLLFPREDAIDCETISLAPDSTVVVIDGTWSEAGKIVRRNPLLATLPAITFKRDIRSRYRIRKQPKDHCLSTLECIAHLLKLNAAGVLLESYQDTYDRLLDGFDRMVEQQLGHYPNQREYE